MTTKAEISTWFKQGVEKGAKHMIVIVDTYDHEDYPVYTSTDFDCLMKVKAPGSMQRVMEVYDLAADEAEQMALYRCMRIPDTTESGK